MLSENEKKAIREFVKPRYWKPNFSEVARVSGIPITTIFDIFKRLDDSEFFELKVEVKLKKDFFG